MNLVQKTEGEYNDNFTKEELSKYIKNKNKFEDNRQYPINMFSIQNRSGYIIPKFEVINELFSIFSDLELIPEEGYKELIKHDSDNKFRSGEIYINIGYYINGTDDFYNNKFYITFTTTDIYEKIITLQYISDCKNTFMEYLKDDIEIKKENIIYMLQILFSDLLVYDIRIRKTGDVYYLRYSKGKLETSGSTTHYTISDTSELYDGKELIDENDFDISTKKFSKIKKLLDDFDIIYIQRNREDAITYIGAGNHKKLEYVKQYYKNLKSYRVKVFNFLD